MNKDEFEEKTVELERLLGIYGNNIKMIRGLVESKFFREAVVVIEQAEDMFSDGLFEELNYFAKESSQIEPPEHELDIIKDSDGFGAGE